MHCAWQVEVNPFCLKVLQKHWPDVPKFKDVRNVGKHNLEPVDLVCGGFPCQPHSISGKRKGAEDDRNLWPEFLRIVKEIRPAWVLAENVPGIVSLYLDQVLSDLESAGYTCWPLNIPACAFNAPHIRKRIFVVAHTDSRTRSHREITQGGECGQVGWTQEQARRCSCDVADASCQFRNGSDDNRGCRPQPLSQSGDSAEETQSFGGWWSSEPDVGRVAHGIPDRVDRLRALGNAVVPQIAEWIGRCIMETERGW